MSERCKSIFFSRRGEEEKSLQTLHKVGSVLKKPLLPPKVVTAAAPPRGRAVHLQSRVVKRGQSLHLRTEAEHRLKIIVKHPTFDVEYLQILQTREKGAKPNELGVHFEMIDVRVAGTALAGNHTINEHEVSSAPHEGVSQDRRVDSEDLCPRQLAPAGQEGVVAPLILEPDAQLLEVLQGSDRRGSFVVYTAINKVSKKSLPNH